MSIHYFEVTGEQISAVGDIDLEANFMTGNVLIAGGEGGQGEVGRERIARLNTLQNSQIVHFTYLYINCMSENMGALFSCSPLGMEKCQLVLVLFVFCLIDNYLCIFGLI